MATAWNVEGDWNRDGAYSEVTDYASKVRYN